MNHLGGKYSVCAAVSSQNETFPPLRETNSLAPPSRSKYERRSQMLVALGVLGLLLSETLTHS